MNPTLVIESAGRSIDRVYVGLLMIFWIVWTALTVWVMALAVTNFSLFFVFWLPFGVMGVFVPPYALIQSRKPQTFEATPHSLLIHGTGIFFANIVEIPRAQVIKLGLGHYGSENNGEFVTSLNVFSKVSWWTGRILIAPFSHPKVKSQIYSDLRIFLSDNGFQVHIEDENSITRNRTGSP